MARLSFLILLFVSVLCQTALAEGRSYRVVQEDSLSVSLKPLEPSDLSNTIFSQNIVWPCQDIFCKSLRELRMEILGFVNISSLSSDIPVDMMYTKADNFTGQVLYYDLTHAYLHPEAAQALLKAQKYLKQIRPDLSLKVYDAARPMSVQQIMWDMVKDTDLQIYVSNPERGGGLHNYGLAVDVTLCHVATGDTLTMGTHIDYLGRRAQVRYEEEYLKSGGLSKEAYENRKLLRQVMVKAGYKVLLSEWWHFNFKSRKEAKENYIVIP